MPIFLQNESIRIDSWFESNRIDSNSESECSNAYADDTQIYGHCQPSDAGCLAQRVAVCIDEISARMKALTAAESRQDRGPLLRLIPTSTLGPDRICSWWWCFGVTGHRCSGPWCLHRQWCHHMRTHVRTSPTSFEHALRHCARSGVCDVPCHSTHC